MGHIAKLNSLCVGLLLLTAIPAWAQKEELWLDSQTGTPVSGHAVLEKGKPYSLTMKGTYSVWKDITPTGSNSGKTEPTPLFASPKGTNKEVGLDPEFIFAWPKGSHAEKSAGSGPTPLRNTAIEVSLDGGKTWKHPSSTAAFDAAGHEYNYVLTGEQSALQVRSVDKPASDNYGRLHLFLLPGA